MPWFGVVTEFRDVFGQALTEAIEGGDALELFEKATEEFQPTLKGLYEELKG